MITCVVTGEHSDEGLCKVNLRMFGDMRAVEIAGLIAALAESFASKDADFDYNDPEQEMLFSKIIFGALHHHNDKGRNSTSITYRPEETN